MTINDVFYHYVQSIRETRAPTTVSTYKHKLAMVSELFKGIDVSEITEEIAQGKFDEVTEKYTSKTLHSLLDVSRAAFSYAVNSNLVHRNPFQAVSVGRVVNHTAVILSKEEMENLMALVSNDANLFLPVLFAVETGLRRSQILGLTWRDVDFSSSELLIEKSVVSSKNHVYSPGKERAVRTVKISSMLASTLLAIKDSRRNNGVPVRDSDYICVTKGHKPMEPTYFDKCFRDFVKSHEELPQNLRFHDLRWSYINSEVSKGKDPMEIARAVGHKSCAYTLDYYCRYKANAS